ncbi:MAG: hypothetical protein R3F62_27670 [Planctomycetota bacterium]
MRQGGIGEAWLAGLTLAFVCALPCQAEFRFEEFEERDFTYHDEYFISWLSFRPRLRHRWRWRDAAVGYFLTVGSLKSTEFYLDQRVRLRVPFSNHLTGEYRLIQTEDYDSRYTRNEVEAVLRVLRPERALPLTQTLGSTPRPDGLFAGATAELHPDKEFVDAGALVGYGTLRSSIRLDVVRPDFTYNQKNDENGEYEAAPWTFRARVRTDLPENMLRLRAWASYDTPLTLSLPQRDGLRFRFRKFEAGGAALWEPVEGVRLDLELRGESTRKRWRYTGGARPDQDLRRSAAWGVAQLEVDVAPAFGAHASRQDVVFASLFAHLLDEVTRGRTTAEVRLRRGEAYGELGYLLALPTPLDEWEGGIRVATQLGALSYRDQRPAEDIHSVGIKFLAKFGVGVEAFTQDQRAGFLVQATVRADEPSFGGANAQVLLRF